MGQARGLLIKLLPQSKPSSLDQPFRLPRSLDGPISFQPRSEVSIPLPLALSLLNFDEISMFQSILASAYAFHFFFDYSPVQSFIYCANCGPD